MILGCLNQDDCFAIDICKFSIAKTENGMIKTAMILGAGFGERLKPLTLVRPKPLLPVLNKTMLEWWAEFLVSAGMKRLVINVHHLAPLMLEHNDNLTASFKGRLEIAASPEEQILGTGGAIKRAEALLGKDDFLVADADIFTDFELVKLSLKQLANPGRLATMGLLTGRDKANVSLGEGGRILGFRYPEPLAGEASRQTYCGVMAVSPEIFTYLPDGPSDIIETFNRAIGQGADIFGWTYDPAIWRDMGTPRDYWELNRDLAAGRTNIHSTALVEGRLSGWNVVGPKARLEEGCAIENSVIWPGVIVSPGVQVKNAVVAGDVPPGTTVDGGVFCDLPGC